MRGANSPIKKPVVFEFYIIRYQPFRWAVTLS